MLKIIAAMAKNGVIGREGQLPWEKLRADMAQFKEKTLGKPVFMGSKSYHALPLRFRPLPGRENIVLTRQPHDWIDDPITLVNSIEPVLKRAETEDIWVVGGGSVYAQMMPYASEIHLTRVEADIEGDVVFPQWNEAEWELVEESPLHEADEQNEYPFMIQVYKRMRNQFIEMSNCRNDKQRDEMQLILHRNHCPFCMENLKRYHDNKILWSGLHWLVSKNDYPYPGSGIHLIFILKTHVTSIIGLPSGAMEDLKDAIRWAKTEFDLDGEGFFMRSGDPLATGATIRHLHGHMATSAHRGDPVKFYLG